MSSSPAITSPQSHLTFLSEASQVLSRSLDYATTLDEVARLYVPLICDGCCIDMLEDGVPQQRATAHVDPQKHALLFALGRFLRASWEQPRGPGAVLRNGEPIYWPTVGSGEREALATSPEHLAVIEALGPTSLMILPLRAHNRVLGAMTLSIAVTGRRPNHDDFVLAMEVAHRAATAIENAQLYSNIERAHAEVEQARKEADRAARRASFLATVTKILNTSLDQHFIFGNLTHMLVPQWADICVVELLQDGRVLTQVAEATHHPEHLEKVRALRAYPPAADSPTLSYLAVQTQHTEIWDAAVGPPPELMYRPNERSRLFAELGLTLVVAAPLVARNGILGAVTLGLGHRPAVDDQDLALIEELVHRAALALDNARLYVEAQAAVAQRDEFLSIASHELRTPLTALQLQLGQLVRLMPKASDAQVRDRFSVKLERASQQTLRLGKLIDNLLDVSRVTAGRLGLERTHIDLAQLVRDVSDRWSDEATRGGSTIEVFAEEPIVGFWDPERLEQVLTNLLSNAVKYGARKTITVRAAMVDGWATFSVRDYGLGIAPEALSRIFERFERAVSSREFGGLGLGLFIARQIVEAHGGTIGVESHPGGGSTFTVTLPLLPVRPSQAVLDHASNHLTAREHEVRPYDKPQSFSTMHPQRSHGGSPRF